MEKENTELFNEANEIKQDNNEMSVELNSETQRTISSEPKLKEPVEEVDYTLGELSDDVKKEVVLKPEDKDKVFEIEEAIIAQPITKDVDGNFIPPKIFNEKEPDKKGYETKLKITLKDSNYILLIPKFKWYVAQKDGKTVLNPWFRVNVAEEDLEDNFTTTIAKLYYKFCVFKGVEPGKLSRSDFVKELVGKKVKLEQYKQKYNGEWTYRIDVKEFVN